jgi:hypothetical protein
MEQNKIDLCLAIKEAVTECIENMAFMSVDTEIDDPLQVTEGEQEVIALIEVLEPKAGELRLTMPRKTAAELAKALFSITDQELSDTLINDLACELLNTISGRVMKRVLPAECLYHLGLPSMAGQPVVEMPPPFVHCRFVADGNLLAVIASIEV